MVMDAESPVVNPDVSADSNFRAPLKSRDATAAATPKPAKTALTLAATLMAVVTVTALRITNSAAVKATVIGDPPFTPGSVTVNELPGERPMYGSGATPRAMAGMLSSSPVSRAVEDEAINAS